MHSAEIPRGHTGVYFFGDAEEQSLPSTLTCQPYRVPPPLKDSALPLGSPLLIFDGSEAPIFESCNFSRCYVPFETEKETNTNPNKIILKLEK